MCILHLLFDQTWSSLLFKESIKKKNIKVLEGPVGHDAHQSQHPHSLVANWGGHRWELLLDLGDYRHVEPIFCEKMKFVTSVLKRTSRARIRILRDTFVDLMAKSLTSTCCHSTLHNNKSRFNNSFLLNYIFHKGLLHKYTLHTQELSLYHHTYT